MTTGRRKAILFASTRPERALRVLDHVRSRWPEHDWTVCIKENEAGWLPGGCPVIRVPRGRPGITAARRLRRGGFDLGVACWCGEQGYGRLKALHLLTPARERHVYDEEGASFALLRRARDPAWLGHLRRRLGRPGERRFPDLVALGRMLYGGTLGPLFGVAFLLGKHALWTLGLRPRARA